MLKRLLVTLLVASTALAAQRTVQFGGQSYRMPETVDPLFHDTDFSAWIDAVSQRAIAGRPTDTLLHVADYGARGGCVKDETVQLQAAFDAAVAQHAQLQFDNTRCYRVTAMLTVTGTVNIIGMGIPNSGGDQTEIRMDSAGTETAVIKVTAGYGTISGIKLNANRKSHFALFLEGVSFGHFDQCNFTGALEDGVNLSVIGTNDANSFRDDWAYDNGRIVCTAAFNTLFDNFHKTAAAGTVATTIGSEIITGTGTAFTGMNIRSGDYLRIGTGISSDQFLQISEVTDATHLKVGTQKVATANLAGAAFAIGIGNGYKEVRHNDNNISTITGGLWRLNAGAGMMFDGLYGPTVTKSQIDYSGFYGIVIGTTDQEVVYATQINNPYFENNLAAPILFGCAIGVKVVQPQYGYLGTNLYQIAASSQNIGTWEDYDGIKPIGNAVSTVPVTTSATTFQLGGTLSHKVVNPGTPVAGTTIAVSGTFMVLPVSGATVMTAVPTLSAGTDGQQVCLMNQTGDSITLQDKGTLAGSTLSLSAATIALSVNDSICLVWYTTAWHQISFTNAL